MSTPEQRNPYPFLQFQPGVDWADANLDLWRRLNQVGAALGKPLQVISGYRSDDHSQAVGGFRGDPHTRGIAADVTVGGVPIGNVPGAMAAIARAGLLSGNTPNFYKGSPDPGHVQLQPGGASAPPGQGGTGGTGSPTSATGSSVAGAGCLPSTLLLGTFFGVAVAAAGHFL